MVNRQRSSEYYRVLASSRWRWVRAHAISRSGGRCTRCGATGRLDGHHAQGYRNLGRERPSEIQPLCRPCHDLVHGKNGPYLDYIRQQERERFAVKCWVWLFSLVGVAFTVLAVLPKS